MFNERAPEMIRKMKKAKVPLANIAAQLNALRIRRETTWTARHIKAFLAEPEPLPVDKSQWATDEKKRLTISMPVFATDEMDIDPDELKVEKSWETMKARACRQQPAAP